MAKSGSPRKSGSGNRRPPGTGNRSAATRRSGAPAAAKPVQAPKENGSAPERPSSEERARERLSQPRSGGKRPPARGGSRPSGRGDPRKRRPQARSTGKTAGIFGGAFVALAVIIIVVISLLSGGGTPSNLVPFTPAPAAYVSAVTHVPASQLAAAGLDGAGPGNVTVNTSVFVATPKQPRITSGGKPVLVYMGAEYCPYCAASRWPLIIALSRFGTFSGLEIGGSSPDDSWASTHTWGFAKAHYTSPYVSFDSTEFTTNVCIATPTNYSCPVQSNGQQYTTLQVPSKADAALFAKYDGPPYFPSTAQGGIPFLDWGGRWVSSGALYSPTNINLGSGTNANPALGWSPLTWQQIINNIQAKPLTSAGQVILATANIYTAAICEMTGGKPASVCNTPVIKAAEKLLPKS
ncbi:MAG TPA: DUF929 family protein [Acidimicrobiales bacterium]|nr:DUF929 family protein [Acidimicrobiales bacterium]